MVIRTAIYKTLQRPMLRVKPSAPRIARSCSGTLKTSMPFASSPSRVCGASRIRIWGFSGRL